MPFGSILGSIAGPLIGGALGGALGSSQQGANTTTNQGTTINTGPFSQSLGGAASNLQNIFQGTGIPGQPLGPASLYTNAANYTLSPLASLGSFGGVGAVPYAASMIAQGGNLATQGATPVTTADINQYLNPYTNDVANYASKLAGQFLTEQALPAVGDTFTLAGQPGSSRQADFDTRAIRDTTAQLQGELGSIYGSGFNTALNEANQQKANMLTGANSLYGGAQGLGNLTNANFSNLATLLNQALQGLQIAGQGSGLQQNYGTVTGPSPSVLSSILGGALSGNALLKQLGFPSGDNSGGNNTPLTEGGGWGTTGSNAGGNSNFGPINVDTSGLLPGQKDGGHVKFAKRRAPSGALSYATS